MKEQTVQAKCPGYEPMPSWHPGTCKARAFTTLPSHPAQVDLLQQGRVFLYFQWRQ